MLALRTGFTLVESLACGMPQLLSTAPDAGHHVKSLHCDIQLNFLKTTAKYFPRALQVFTPIWRIIDIELKNYATPFRQTSSPLHERALRNAIRFSTTPLPKFAVFHTGVACFSAL